MFIRVLPSEHKRWEDFLALRKLEIFLIVNAYLALSPPLWPNLTVVTYKVFPLVKNDLISSERIVRMVCKW